MSLKRELAWHNFKHVEKKLETTTILDTGHRIAGSISYETILFFISGLIQSFIE